MNDSSGYELALLVSKRLRWRLLKASAFLALVAIGFSVIYLAAPRSMWVSVPVWLRYFLVGVPIPSIAGGAFGFAARAGISIRAAVFAIAAEDVLEGSLGGKYHRSEHETSRPIAIIACMVGSAES